MSPGNAIAVAAEAAGVSGGSVVEQEHREEISVVEGVKENLHHLANGDVSPPQLSPVTSDEEKDDVEMKEGATGDAAAADELNVETKKKQESMDMKELSQVGIIPAVAPTTCPCSVPCYGPLEVNGKGPGGDELNVETKKEEEELEEDETQLSTTADDVDDDVEMKEELAPVEQQKPEAAAVEVAAAAAAPAEPAVEEEQQCLICYDVLFNKRAVTCIPCMHSTHRTCAIAWLESRTDATTQFCPSCRVQVELIADIESGEELEGVPAFGQTGQPARTLIEGVMYHSVGLARYLQEETENTILLMSKIGEQQRIARACGKSDTYISDFDDETQKLMSRLTILEQLTEEWRIQRHQQTERDMAEAAAQRAQQAAAQAAAAAAQQAALQQAQAAAAAAAAAAPDAAVAAALAAAVDAAVEAAEPMEVEERSEQPTAADAAGVEAEGEDEEEVEAAGYELD